jgi:RHS repeat-associated protein
VGATGAARTTTEERTPALSDGLAIATVTAHPGSADYELEATLTRSAKGVVTSTQEVGKVDGLDQTRTTTLGTLSFDRYPAGVTNAESRTTSLTYDLRYGAPKTTTDPNSNVTTITRDAFGRVIEEERADGTKITYDFVDCTSTWCNLGSNVLVAYGVRIESKNGTTQVAPTRRVVIDALGGVVRDETEAFDSADGWVRTEIYRDATGRVNSRSLPYHSSGGTPTFVYFRYDQEGRVILVDRPGGSDVTHDYTYVAGKLAVLTTESVTNQRKQNSYDARGLLVSTVDGYGTTEAQTTTYSYTTTQELDTVTVAGELMADLGYDSFGFRTSLNHPSTGTTTFAFDAWGAVIETTDAKNDRSILTYDRLGRLTDREDGHLVSSTFTATRVSEWSWDGATNGVGYLASRTSGPSSTTTEFTETLAYDSLSRPSSVTTSVNVSGFTASGTYSVSYGYDSAGRLATETWPNGAAFTYVYNTRGYQSQVKQGTTVLHERAEYDAFGNETLSEYGNGIRTAREFDANTGLITSIETGTTGTPRAVQDLLYAWQKNGLLEYRKDERGTTSTADDRTETFSYDGLMQLEQVATTGFSRTLSFAYDDLNNLTSKTNSNPGDLDVTSYSYDVTIPDRLSSVSIGGVTNTLSYDGAGNITEYDAASGDDTFIDYDDANHAVKITVGSSSTDSTPTARDEFWYGPDGQRFLRRETWMDGSLQTSWTLYLQGGRFEEVRPEFDSATTYRQRVQVTDAALHVFEKPSASAGSSSVSYVHRDHLGSVSAITDGSGVEQGRYAFDPFGGYRDEDWVGDLSSGDLSLLRSDLVETQGRGFTDHEALSRTGFTHMNGRVYDSRIGRFVQPDPLVGRPSIGANFNKYSYVFNSPLSGIDSSGFDCADSCPIGIVGYGPSTWEEHMTDIIESDARVQALLNFAASLGETIGPPLESAAEVIRDGVEVTSNVMATMEYSTSMGVEATPPAITNDIFNLVSELLGGEGGRPNVTLALRIVDAYEGLGNYTESAVIFEVNGSTPLVLGELDAGAVNIEVDVRQGGIDARDRDHPISPTKLDMSAGPATIGTFVANGKIVGQSFGTGRATGGVTVTAEQSAETYTWFRGRLPSGPVVASPVQRAYHSVMRN